MADVDIAGVRLHVQRLGSQGDPVVFLHGLVMDNLSSWYFTLANPVAQTHRVWLYDYRGHGRSSRPVEGYRLQDLVGELEALLDHEGIDSVRLVGHSFGGTVALAFAMLHPKRTKGLVLLDAHVPDSGWGARMASTLELEPSARNGVIAERFQAWLGRHSERKRTKLELKARALLEGTSMIEDLKQSIDWPLEDFARLTMPITLLNGTESDVRVAAEALVTVLPNHEMIWVEGTHSILWERTEDVKHAILGCFDG